MAFLGIFGNFDKPGPGVNKDEPPKAAPVRFFEILIRKFTKLVQLNLIFLIPTLIVAVLMVLVYFSPMHFILQLPTEGDPLQLDVWTLYAVPFPLILLSPFVAGLTFVTRNFSREEHAFVWSDFWDTVKGNWKYFLLNGVLCYVMYLILSFSIIYYFNRAAFEWFYYIPFWLCIVLALIFVFAQYYLPMMFITFDLKFGQAYKNALIFSMAGFFRNILITAILGGLFILAFAVIPVMGLTIMIFLLIIIFILFSFVSYLINFTIYPIIDSYLIQPYQQRVEETNVVQKQEEKFPALFKTAPDEDDTSNVDTEDDKYVYVNGKLIKKSELKDN